MTLRSPRERLIQTISYEIGGLCLSVPLVVLFGGGTAGEAFWLMLALAAAVLIWSPIHNTVFDWLDLRLSGRLATALAPGSCRQPRGDDGRRDTADMIAESHISFHTFPGRGFVTIDLYTCQTGLNRQATIDRLLQAFHLFDAEVHVQERGLRYPAENLAAS